MTPPPDSLYLQQEISARQLPSTENRMLFLGIDMAPIDSLETGLALIDRDRRLLRMDKRDRDRDILKFVHNIGQRDNLIIALDIPKSLGISSKWRQQKAKMHPLSLMESGPVLDEDDDPVDPLSERFAERAMAFYERLKGEGYFIFNYFTPHAKLHYDLTVPYKNRTPQGCRAQQAAIKQNLKIQDLPNNLAPSSVLDAMIGAYTAWSVWQGQDKTDFQFYLDDAERLYLYPHQRPADPKPLRWRRMYRLKRISPPRRSRDNKK